MLIEHIEREFAGEYHTLQVGTGDGPLTVPFYEHCGFVRSHVVKDFFTQNYERPIFEGGVQLVDMVYFSKRIGKSVRPASNRAGRRHSEPLPGGSSAMSANT